MFRIENIHEQHITGAGFRNSGVVDRYFFQSFYFRDLNGILYELATSEGAGLARKSGVEHPGKELDLPDFLEPQRAQIEARLRPLPIYGAEQV